MPNWSFRLIALASFALFGAVGQAEPWLASKFSNNCASCHSPGRKNVEFKNRRCSLSCQSCHVNPNGGGLRNFYGKWNEDHWLASFRIKDYLKSKGVPAPLPEQKYANMSDNRVIQKLYAKVGPPLQYLDQRPEDMTVYGPNTDKNFETIVTEENKDEWFMTVPDEDPYRQMDRTKVDGGGDFRYVVRYLSSKREVNDKESKKTINENLLLTGDIGVRFRPLNRNLHLVFENRYVGQTIDKISDWNSEFIRRSMYALVDDMPYNSFGMVGIFKPLIGNNLPDHTVLSELIKSQALADNEEGYGFAYEGLTVGAAPGVPFANLHLMGRQYINGKMANDSHLGFAANLGGRFTAMGFTPTYTFLFSKRDDRGGSEVKALLHELTLGGHIGRATVELDFMYYSKSVNEKTYINGTHFGGEVHVQAWQDVYGFASFGYATTARVLLPGSSVQLRAGVRGFLLPGVDISLAGVYDQDETTKESLNTSDTTYGQLGFIGQVHLYL